MAVRSPYAQSCHDSAVRSDANALVRQGWIVRADVAGFVRPDLLCVNGDCRRPDIIAVRGGTTLIIEWETESPCRQDLDQHEVFREFARRRPNATFEVRVC